MNLKIWINTEIGCFLEIDYTCLNLTLNVQSHTRKHEVQYKILDHKPWNSISVKNSSSDGTIQKNLNPIFAFKLTFRMAWV